MDHIPAVRPGLTLHPDRSPNRFVLVDDMRITQRYLVLNRLQAGVAGMIDGRLTLRQIQADIMTRGGLLSDEALIELIDMLDEALFLDSPRFAAYINGSERLPSCIGCYPAQVDQARLRLKRLFTDPGGPGLPNQRGCRIASEGRLKAIFAPHIDYERGGVAYGWAYKELIERTTAKLFVIIGTSHYSPERFTLTRKNFSSPFGAVETDQVFIDRLEREYGPGLFDDPYAHLPEHSIELEVVMLQYLLEGREDFRIVPLLTGSYGDCIQNGRNPATHPDIARMVAALQSAERSCSEEVCYIISGDLAHIGRQFDDPDLLTDTQLEASYAKDRELIEAAADVDATRVFDLIATEKDARRICGLPPLWLTLATAKPNSGRILYSNQHVDDARECSVSFAALAFE